MKLIMPKNEILTPRQQAAVYYAEGFTWEKSCAMAGYDEEADMRGEVLIWSACMALCALFCLVAFPALLDLVK